MIWSVYKCKLVIRYPNGDKIWSVFLIQLYKTMYPVSVQLGLAATSSLCEIMKVGNVITWYETQYYRSWFDIMYTQLMIQQLLVSKLFLYHVRYFENSNFYFMKTDNIPVFRTIAVSFNIFTV